MGRALLSVVVALAGAAGVTASGLALQAVALPPPVHADHVAADTSAWLHDHRLVIDVFHVDHRRIKGACLSGWFAGPNGVNGRASLLSVGSGPVLRVSDRGHVSRTGARHRSHLPIRLLAVAGCANRLSRVLAVAVQTGDHVTTERSYAAGQPAIALEAELSKEKRLTLYVSPSNFRPLVAIVDVEGEVATARLYLSRLGPRLLRRFHLPPRR